MKPASSLSLVDNIEQLMEVLKGVSLHPEITAIDRREILDILDRLGQLKAKKTFEERTNKRW